eukprot:543238-Pelagomonas_calceolata.AAC.2
MQLTTHVDMCTHQAVSAVALLEALQCIYDSTFLLQLSCPCRQPKFCELSTFWPDLVTGLCLPLAVLVGGYSDATLPYLPFSLRGLMKVEEFLGETQASWLVRDLSTMVASRHQILTA